MLVLEAAAKVTHRACFLMQCLSNASPGKTFGEKAWRTAEPLREASANRRGLCIYGSVWIDRWIDILVYVCMCI